MKENSNLNGNCLICGSWGKLSFEHVPPKSAFNTKPILLQQMDDIEKGTGKRINKGFGAYTLCESCNKKTGGWYGSAFSAFAKTGMELLLQESKIIKGWYGIKPLNVFKQIITMFFTADRAGELRSIPGLKEFILDKESQLFPEGIQIHLYSNASKHKRLFGLTTVYDPELGIQKWAEINFQPFGFFLTLNSHPPNNYMLNITEFNKFKYGQHTRVEIQTNYLEVSSPVIGLYDNLV